MSSDPSPNAVLHPDRMNVALKQAEYAIRGRLYQVAADKKKRGDRVIFTNTGNPQALGQKPITFLRQILALTTYPQLLDQPAVLAASFAPDAVQRARTYLAHIPGGTGAYQDSRGNEYIREEVAAFLAGRDGQPAVADDIFLTDGASHGITLCLRAVIRDARDGVLVPSPQYPLYSATITMLGGAQCSYDLDEDASWDLSVAALDRCVAAARARGVIPRALVVINPGNPVGTSLSHRSLAAIAVWCCQQRVVLFADEVYQQNVYGPHAFVSFKRLACEIAAASTLELFSFHSVSKGYYGECGRRGAYFETHNIHPAVVKSEIYKAMSLNLSTNVLGQVAVGVMVNPPRPGDASFAEFAAESTGILASLGRRATTLVAAFNALPGVSCTAVDGAMYAFPRITLPARAVQAARAQGLDADAFYCLELLQHTGICVVPGAGFGQQAGTHHFRTTILPAEEDIADICALFSSFHLEFLARYSEPSDGGPADRDSRDVAVVPAKL